MATNFVQQGAVMTITAGGTIASGDPVLVVDVLGIATHDAVSGESLVLAMEGVFEVAKDNNLVIAQGDRVFWDAANAWVDKTATAQFNVGVAWEAAALTATTVVVKLGATTPAGT